MSILDIPRDAWFRIIDYVIGPMHQYSYHESWTLEMHDLPLPIQSALIKDDKTLGTLAMISVAFAKKGSHYRCFTNSASKSYAPIVLLRNVCRNIKGYVDYRAAVCRQYFKQGHVHLSSPFFIPSLRHLNEWDQPPISPWARWIRDRIGYSRCESAPSTENPFHKIDRDLDKEARDSDWNNRSNKYKIRIMWQEYKRANNPWHTPRFRCYRVKQWFREERAAYNAFRYNMTREEFEARWLNT